MLRGRLAYAFCNQIGLKVQAVARRRVRFSRPCGHYSYCDIGGQRMVLIEKDDVISACRLQICLESIGVIRGDTERADHVITWSITRDEICFAPCGVLCLRKQIKVYRVACRYRSHDQAGRCGEGIVYDVAPTARRRWRYWERVRIQDLLHS